MATEFGWFDFEEDDSTDAIPGKYILTIFEIDEQANIEEVAVMVHRTAGGKYPLFGDVASKKRRMARRIVDLLNEHGMEA